MEKYRIKILHIVNPHLIWAEAMSDDHKTFKYLQLGLDGILPLSPHFNDVDNKIKFEPDLKWTNGTTLIMYDCLQEADSVWFQLNFIDYRDTIFDTTDHLYGEIIVKTSTNGSIIKLSNILTNGCVAYKNEEMFNEYLANGKLCTRLLDHETNEVITSLEKAIQKDIITSDKMTNVEMTGYRINALHARLSVYFLKQQEIEELEKRSDLKQYVVNVHETFKYIKDSDQVSYGRGYRTNTRRKRDHGKDDKINHVDDNISHEDDKVEDVDKFTTDKRIQNWLDQFDNLKLKGFVDDYNTTEGTTKVISKFLTRRKITAIPKHITDSSRGYVDSDNNDSNKSLQSESQRASIISKLFTRRNLVTSPEAKVTDNSNNNIDSDKSTTNTTLHSESDNPVTVSKFLTRRKIAIAPSQKTTYTAHSNINSNNNMSHAESENPVAVSKFFLRRNLNTALATKTDLSVVNSDNNISNTKTHSESDDTVAVSKFFTKRNIRTAPALKTADTNPSNILSDNNISHSESESPVAVSNFYTKRNINTANAHKTTDTSLSNILSDNNILHSESDSPVAVSNFYTKRNIKTAHAHKTSDTSPTNINSNNNISHSESDSPIAVSKFYTKRNIKTTHAHKTADSPSSVLSDNNISHSECDNPVAVFEFCTSHGKMNYDNNKISNTISHSDLPVAISKFSPKKNFNATSAQTTPVSIYSNVNSNNNIISHKYTTLNNIEYDSDNESTASCLLDRIRRLNPQTEATAKEKIKKTTKTPVKTHTPANFFNNVNSSISKFVDRLVTPVLMVHTNHNEVIEPLVDLREFNFNSTISAALSSMSVKCPMMVQSLSWYSILRGYSTFMISPLNSGKTLGYTPCVCQLVVDCEDDAVVSHGQGPVCIIMCATSNSVIKVARQCRSFLKSQKTVLSCYPGVNEKEMTLLLLNGCDIFVCTPCALVRFLSNNNFSLDLRRLSLCVFDNFERLDEVYINEVKYLLAKIKETCSARINKAFKVQYVIASRTWCSSFEQLAKKCSNSVICIGAYQECVLYSKTHTTVSFVQRKNKLAKLVEFFNEIDSRKRAVVVCRTDEEVKEVSDALAKQHRVVLSADNRMTVEVLYRLSTDWFQYGDPILAPVLVCCDSNLGHLNITNACYLFHYSLPNLYSAFCKRFSCLTDNFTSIFEEGAQNNVRVGIILEESNAEQLPKIVNFIRRCKNEIPAILNEITENVKLENDRSKAESLVPVCDNLLLFGQCAEYWNCKERHSLFKEFDSPQDWCPKSGVITFMILHYKNAVTYSVRLLSNIVNGVTNKYPQNYATLCMKMGLYYSKEDNKIPHGIPRIGDICAVGINAYKYERCKVVKILSTYRNGNPKHVLVKLIDEEKWERTKDIDLYHLPDDLKNMISYVVEVKLCGLQPNDRDVMFSDLAEKHLRDLLNMEKTFYLKANVVAVVGNNVMVDDLNVCQELSSLKTTVVRYSFKEELLRNHALEDKEQIPKLLDICQKSGLIVKEDMEAPSEAPSTTKQLPEPQWAHFDKEELSLVYFASAEHPGKFFVRHVKFDDCLQLLTNDIQKYISESNVESISNVVVDQYVLAKFPDDSLYYRARVDAIDDAKIKCFFVDHGDWRFVNIKDIYELTEGFIKQIPFQAIECRLVALKPPGGEWPEISTNWLCNLCFIGDSEDSKQLYVKYYTKESAESTDGNKYGVVIIDTTSNVDLIFNQSLLDANFARVDEDELQYLDECMRTFNIKADTNMREFEESEEKQWELEAEPYLDKKFVRKLDDNNQLEGSQGSLMNTLFAKVPQKSITLDDDDEYDSDQWEMQMDVSEMSKSLGLPVTTDSCPSVTPDSFVKIDSAEPNSDFEMLSPVPKIVELDAKPKANHVSPEPKAKKLTPEAKVKEVSLDLKVKELPPEPKAKRLSAEAEELFLDPKSKEILSGSDELLKPKINWYQRDSLVVIKIEVLGMLQYNLNIEQRALSFETKVQDKVYGFTLNLYGIVDPAKSTHAHKGLYVQVKLVKFMNRKWLSLHVDAAKRKWISYDQNALESSSDEDDTDQIVSKQTLKNIVEAAHYNDSDAESDINFRDDLEQKYKHDSD